MVSTVSPGLHSNAAKPWSRLSPFVWVCSLHELIVFYFFCAKLQNGHSWHQATWQLGLAFSEVYLACDLLSDKQNEKNARCRV